MKTIQLTTIFLLSIFAVGCKQKMPSTYEVHYPEGLKDSVVFVNYNLTADRSCNFYMKYNLFFSIYKKDNFEPVYQYYLKHSEIKRGQSEFKGYKPLGFYSNHDSDTIEYYGGHSYQASPKSNSLKPTNSYQPTRTYNPRK